MSPKLLPALFRFCYSHTCYCPRNLLRVSPPGFKHRYRETYALRHRRIVAQFSACKRVPVQHKRIDVKKLPGKYTEKSAHTNTSKYSTQDRLRLCYELRTYKGLAANLRHWADFRIVKWSSLVYENRTRAMAVIVSPVSASEAGHTTLRGRLSQVQRTRFSTQDLQRRSQGSPGRFHG